MIPFPVINKYGNRAAAIPTIRKAAGQITHGGILYGNGELYLRGENAQGQYGNGTTVGDMTTWTKVRSDVSDFWIGDGTTLIKTVGGLFLYAGMKRTFGEAIEDSTETTFTDISSKFTSQIGALTDIVDVQIGTYSSLVLLRSGDLYGAGTNGWQELGIGSTGAKTTYSIVNTNVKKVQLKSVYSYVLKNDGTLYSAGRNTNGALGQGVSTAFIGTWTRCSILSTANQYVKDINIQSAYSAMIISSTSSTGTNTYHSTGYNVSGKLGIGSTTNITSFTQISSPSGFNILIFGNGYSDVYCQSVITSLGVYSSGTGYLSGLSGVNTNYFRAITNSSIFSDASLLTSLTYCGKISGSSYFSFVVYNQQLYAVGSANWMGGTAVSEYTKIQSPYNN